MAQEIRHYRRYCLLAGRAARVLDQDFAGSLLWKGKQEREPGVALPNGFLQREALVAAGYSTVEDLDGASVAELNDAGFANDTANAILAALQPLL